ncbi:hypothetical protein PL373_13675 [Tenacibaculum maritimum]|nr:hypothetical protein [Tenacibaculum maritimum]MDB0602179.1 hypothetical protein [Tenacibaculum maritimum]MDB0613855.1 hypothetical protein [Tenacibaculum maritimum]
MEIFNKKTTVNTYIKKHICDSMFRDSNQFLWRVHYLIRTNEFSDKNWYSKIHVDLLMAIESDLKAMIVALSKNNESPEDAYKKARSYGHNISNLYQEVEIRAKNRLKLIPQKKKELIIDKYTRLKVSNRYELVTFYDIRTDTQNLNFTDSSLKNILSYNSLIEFEKLAIELHDVSKNAISKKPMIALNGRKLTLYFRRLNEFKNNIGRL